MQVSVSTWPSCVRLPVISATVPDVPLSALADSVAVLAFVQLTSYPSASLSWTVYDVPTGMPAKVRDCPWASASVLPLLNVTVPSSETVAMPLAVFP